MKDLKDLFYHEIIDLHSAESQMIDAMPQMIETASSNELKQAFKDHLEETKEQLRKVQHICDKLNLATDEKCKAMEGLIKEVKDFISEEAEPEVRDAGLIACAQRIEHYEMAGYGTAVHYAKKLGYTEHARDLASILEQEGNADKKLNKIAVGNINEKAMS